MLLRSSSTPLLGSLLTSITESPNNNINHHETNTTIKHHYPPSSSTLHHNHNKLNSVGSLHISCNSSPITTHEANKGFRRTQSEENLQGLAYVSCNTNNLPNNTNLKPKRVSGRAKCSMLQTIPSFLFYNSKGRREEEDDDSDVEDDKEIQESLEEEIEEPERVIMAMDGGDISLECKEKNMVLSEEIRAMDKIWNLGLEQEKGLVNQGLFLARGLGIGGGGGGGRGEFNPAGSGEDGGDNQSVEEYYKKMVEENPGNPLFLGNYAQFLYQSKQDLQGAEEYYSRAILVDPKDGDILSQYAKLVWELHHDQDRASIYFERAVQSSPEDSHVHAAYANFLWETEEDEDECSVPSDFHYMPSQFREGALASTNA